MDKTGGILKWSGKILFLEDRLGVPARRRTPTFYYTCSLSDLFHEHVSVRRIGRVFEAMSNAPHHRFQVITKRIDRAPSISPDLAWPDNILLGVSVENQDYLHRLDSLRRIPARLKFACFEPLLEPITQMDLTGLDGVVVGGEFGRKWRSPDLSWVRSIRDVCQANAIPFYFSQHGGRGKRRTGRQLDGREWTDLPIGLWPNSAELESVSLDQCRWHCVR